MTQQYPQRCEIFQWLKDNDAQTDHVLTYYYFKNPRKLSSCYICDARQEFIGTSTFHYNRFDTDRDILPVQLIDIPFLREPSILPPSITHGLNPVRVIATWEQPKEETWRDLLADEFDGVQHGELELILSAFERDMDRKYGASRQSSGGEK